MKGNIVLVEGVYSHADNYVIQYDDKMYLGDLQKDRILISDIIYVVNKDDYIGITTKELIDFAKDHNKEIKYLYNTTQTNEI